MADIQPFISQLQSADSEKAMTGLMADALAHLGFETYNYGSGRISEQRGVLVDRIWSTMDPQWISHYAEKGYFREDRLVIAAFTRLTPFTFDEIFSSPVSTPSQLEMERVFAYRTGLVVPIHGPDATFAILSAAAAGPKREVRTLSPALIATVQHFAIAFRERERQIDLPRTPPPLAGPLPVLSDRQQKALGWCATGKTNWEIGRLLGVSERTAKKHVEEAMHKLGAKTRGQAVTIAIELGLIRP